MKPWRIILAAILFLAFTKPLCVFGKAPSTLSADEIVKKADEARAPSGAFSFVAKVTDMNGGSVSQVTTYRVYAKGNDLSLVDTLAPARLRGRKLLMRGNDLWLYLPSIHRPTRVSFQQKLTGEVANGDIARTNFAHDYSAKLLGKDTVNGKPAYKLYLTASHKDVTYNNITYWVEERMFYPVKAVFYALSGKPLKNAVYSKFDDELGHSRMTHIVITDDLNPKKQSILDYSDFKRESLSDSFFSKEALAE